MIDLRKVLTTLATVLVVALGAWGWWSWRLAGERKDALRQAELAQLRHEGDSLKHVGDSLKQAFRRDTVRLFRSLTTVDTLIQHRIDTAVVHQTDTVKITVREATAIQDTIRSCRQTVLTCAQRADAAEIRAAKADAAVQLALRPAPLSKLVTHDAIAVGVGYLLRLLTAK